MYADVDHVDQVGHVYQDPQHHIKSKSYRSQRSYVYRTELDTTDQVNHTNVDYYRS